MAVIEGQGNRYLQGNYGPVAEELTVTDLPVTGQIPSGLSGRYLRIGPNPWPVPEGPYHWFTGDGMVHGVELGGGQARWYRNRWVRTSGVAERLGEEVPPGPPPPMYDTSNTNVLGHAGRIVALTEGSMPYELSPELDTIGRTDFGGPLPGGFTAHPKLDPVTGEMLGFAYGPFPPYLRYHRIAADGTLAYSQDIDIPGPSMMHDFSVTERHVVFYDLPVVFKMELLETQPFPFAWDDAYGARLGVMAREGGTVDWYEVEPCFVFHPMNAYDDGDRIVLDVVRYPDMFRPSETEKGPLVARQTLDRWTIDRAAGKVLEERLDDRAQEFPQVDPRVVGRRHRYGYAPEAAVSFDLTATRLLKHDLTAGTTEVHDFGPGRVPGEASFAPAPDGTGEDEGWLITFVYDAATDRSDLAIVDASQPSAPPVALVHLPVRVPFGFHGSWIPD